MSEQNQVQHALSEWFSMLSRNGSYGYFSLYNFFAAFCSSVSLASSSALRWCASDCNCSTRCVESGE